MKVKPKTAAKPSLVEFAFLVCVCPLAGVGAALAFASVLFGLAIAGLGLVAVGVYGALTFGLATNLVQGLRERRLSLPFRREETRRLSVTEIAARRLDVAADRTSAPDAQMDGAKSAEMVRTPSQDRVAPIRLRALR